MTERNSWLIAAPIVAALFVGGSWLPPYVMPLAVVLLAGGVRYWSDQRQVRAYRQRETAPAPELEAWVRRVVAQVGRPDLVIQVITGAGRPYFWVERGVAEVSPQLCQCLDDEEMAALLRRELLVPGRRINRLAFFELMAVPLLLFALSGLWWRRTGTPLFLDTALASGIWFVSAMQTGLYGWWTRRWTIRSYVQSGADLVPYIRASLKLHFEAYYLTPPEGRRASAGLCYQKHRAMAAAAGLSQEQLASIGQAAGVPPELYTPVPMKELISRNLMVFGLLFCVLRLYVLIF